MSEDERYEAWKKHMRSLGMSTSREEFEKIEEEYRTAPTEEELFVAYKQWCASKTLPIGDREAFVIQLRGMYKCRLRDSQVIYPGVKVKGLFQ